VVQLQWAVDEVLPSLIAVRERRLGKHISALLDVVGSSPVSQELKIGISGGLERLHVPVARLDPD
jgi:hypothetical protein